MTSLEVMCIPQYIRNCEASPVRFCPVLRVCISILHSAGDEPWRAAFEHDATIADTQLPSEYTLIVALL